MAWITEQELAEIEERIESAHAYESFISPERVEDLVAEVRRLRGLLAEEARLRDIDREQRDRFYESLAECMAPRGGSNG